MTIIEFFLFSILSCFPFRTLSLATPALYERSDSVQTQQVLPKQLPHSASSRALDEERWYGGQCASQASLHARDPKVIIVEADIYAILEQAGYKVVDKLGCGAYGTVYHVKRDNKDYAAKVPALDKDYSIESIEHEVAAYRSIKKHINILSMEDAIQAKTREGKVIWILVTEYCRRRDLWTHMQTQIGKPRKVQGMKGLLQDLLHVHRKGWYHGDIKPGNIIVGPANWKLADFGAAQQSSRGDPRGTWLYLGPEVTLKEDIKYDLEKLDVFALGVTFYEIMYGKKPWNDPEEIPEKTKNKSWRIQGMSILEIDLFLKMLDGNPKERANLKEVEAALKKL